MRSNHEKPRAAARGFLHLVLLGATWLLGNGSALAAPETENGNSAEYMPCSPGYDCGPPLPSLTLEPQTGMIPCAILGQAFGLDLTASGGTGDLSIAVVPPVPPGLTFGDNRLSGTPTAAGHHTLTVVVRDLTSGKSLYSQLDVNVTHPLMFTGTGSLPTATAGTGYDHMLPGATGGVPPYLYELSGALPPGLSFRDGKLSGTPNTAGTYPFSITAQNAPGECRQSTAENFSLTVNPPDSDTREEVQALVNKPFSYPIPKRSCGIDLTPRIPDLPPGLQLQDGMLSGAPTRPGTFPLQLDLFAPGGTLWQTRHLTLVVGNEELIIATRQFPPLVVDQPPTARLEALGGTPPYQWTADSGLPPGIRLRPDGWLDGMATAGGRFAFEVRVTDSRGTTAQTLLTLEVIDADTLRNGLEGPAPSGLSGHPYALALPILGGTPPYRCSAPVTGLPAGLSLDGCQLHGTPTQSGNFGINILVDDTPVAPPGVTAQAAATFTLSLCIVPDTPIPQGGQPQLAPTPRTLPLSGEFTGRGPGADQPDESVEALASDPYGNRYLAGFSYNGRNYDIELLKISSDGKELWRHSFDSGDQDYGYGVAVDPAGQGIYLVGYRAVGLAYQALLLKFDPQGRLLWRRDIKPAGIADTLYAVLVDASGIFVAGESYNGRVFEALVQKYDPDGNRQWQHRYPDPAGENSTAYVLLLRSSDQGGGLLVGGGAGTDTRHGWLLVLDPDTGARLVVQQVSPDAAVQALTGFGAQLFTGGTGPGNDWVLQGLDGDLRALWRRDLAHDGEQVLRALGVDQDGYLYAIGRRFNDGSNDLFLVLLDGDGNLMQTWSYDLAGDERGRALVTGPAGRLTVAGEAGGLTDRRYLLIEVDNGKAY